MAQEYFECVEYNFIILNCIDRKDIAFIFEEDLTLEFRFSNGEFKEPTQAIMGEVINYLMKIPNDIGKKIFNTNDYFYLSVQLEARYDEQQYDYKNINVRQIQKILLAGQLPLVSK